MSREKPSLAHRTGADLGWHGLLFGLAITVVVIGAIWVIMVLARPQPRFASPASPTVDPSPSLGAAGIGEAVTVRQSNGFWPCGSTPDAFDELMKWASRGDSDAVKRAMRVTHSIGLDGGMSVKILDLRFGKRKVRVLTNAEGQAYLKDEQGTFAADPRIGRECWIVSEALSR